MRLTVLNQMGKLVGVEHKGEKFEEKLERIKWFLWHNSVYKTLPLTAGTIFIHYDGSPQKHHRTHQQKAASMQSEQVAWLVLLDEIGEENMTQPEAASGWSIKDIVAHITEWRRRTVLRFRAALDPTRDMTPP